MHLNLINNETMEILNYLRLRSRTQRCCQMIFDATKANEENYFVATYLLCSPFEAS